jgi:hypothetical protein
MPFIKLSNKFIRCLVAGLIMNNAAVDPQNYYSGAIVFGLPIYMNKIAPTVTCSKGNYIDWLRFTC